MTPKSQTRDSMRLDRNISKTAGDAIGLQSFPGWLLSRMVFFPERRFPESRFPDSHFPG